MPRRAAGPARYLVKQNSSESKVFFLSCTRSTLVWRKLWTYFARSCRQRSPSTASPSESSLLSLDHLKTDILPRETEFDEVYAYQQLMDFETARVSAKPERKHRATVHTSTARRSASASVSAATSAYNGSGSDHHGGGGGHSYTHQTR